MANARRSSFRSKLSHRQRRPTLRLEHDPEKWVPVFPRDKRGTRLRGDHAQTKDKRDDVSSSPSLPRPLFQCGHSMDIAVLLLSMCLFFAVGMPIAFAMALAALTGALWI